MQEAPQNIFIKETIETLMRLKTMLRHCVLWMVLYGYFIASLLENEVLADNNFEKFGKPANLSKLACYMLKCFDHFDKSVMGFNMMMPKDDTFKNVISKNTDPKNMISKYLLQINYLTNLIENYRVVTPRMKSNSRQRINFEPKHTVNFCRSKPLSSVDIKNLTSIPKSAQKIKNKFIAFSGWQNYVNKNKMIDYSLNQKTMSATATPLAKRLDLYERLLHYKPYYESLAFKQPTPHINHSFIQQNKVAISQNNYANDCKIGNINKTDREVYLLNHVLPTGSKQIRAERCPTISFAIPNLLKLSSNLSSKCYLNDRQLSAPNFVTQVSDGKSNLSKYIPLPEFPSNSEKNKFL